MSDENADTDSDGDVAPEQWRVPSAGWIAEAARRSAEIDSGQMSAAPWQEVRERVRRRAGL